MDTSIKLVNNPLFMKKFVREKGVSAMKKKKEIRLEDKLKYEIAQELGLYDKVIREGWKSLSARETGKIGGMITKRKRELKKEAEKKFEK